MSIRTKCSLFRALLIGLVLLLATLVLVGCPSAEDKQAEDMLGTNVKLPGVWESDYVSYTFNSLEYSGTIQLLFTENKLQISAPHGTSEVHSYTRNGISLTIEDPYASFPIPYSYVLTFSDGNFSTSLEYLEFMKDIKQSITYHKVQDSAIMLEPTGIKKPEVGTELKDKGNNLVYLVGEDGNATVLRSVDMDKQNWSCVIPEEFGGVKITAIAENGFAYCKGLTSVVIPDTVKVIGDGAFAFCSSITSIIIPDGVTTIGNEAFAYCFNLQSVTLFGKYTGFGEKVFDSSFFLREINIPAGTKEHYVEQLKDYKHLIVEVDGL